MKALALRAGCALAAVSALPGAAAAQELPDPAFASAAVVADAELAELRGGFVWEGVNVALGAEIRSYLRDELVMQTNISWSATGTEVNRYVSGTLSEASAANLQQALTSGGGLAMNAGPETLYVANGGQTAFLHRVDGGLQNVVLNTANNADLRQEFDVQVDLGNFAPLQAMSLGDRITTGLASEITSALSALSAF